MARKYYYDSGEQKVGPVTGSKLVQLRADGEIGDDTWVRRENSSTWRPLSAVDLRAEEEQERNPSLWRMLLHSLSWRTIALLIAFFVIFATLLAGIIRYAWPLVLILFVLWSLNRISKS